MFNDIFEKYKRILAEQEIVLPIKIKIDVQTGEETSGVGNVPPEDNKTEDDGVTIDDIEPVCAELSDDERVLAAIDDYFKTLNDGQYSPMSGEHNNASISTEVYMIARKHGVDPEKLFSHLNDTVKFDKFQKISTSGVPQITETKNLVEYAGMIDKARNLYVKHMKPEAYKKHMDAALNAFMTAKKVRGEGVWRGIASAYRIDPAEFKKAIDSLGKPNNSGGVLESTVDIDPDLIVIDRMLRKDGTSISGKHPMVKNKDGGYTVVGKNDAVYVFDSEWNMSKTGGDDVNEGFTVVPNIDRERYPNRDAEGLDGPFRNKHGRVYYYDVKAGKYYDPNTDMYLEVDDIMETKMNPLDSSISKFVNLMEGKKMSAYEGRLKLILEKLGVNYLEKDGHIFVAEPFFSKIKAKFPDLAGVIRERHVCNESCTAGGTCAGSVASVSIPIGTIQKRDVSEAACSCGCRGGQKCSCGPNCCESACFCRKSGKKTKK